MLAVLPAKLIVMFDAPRVPADRRPPPAAGTVVLALAQPGSAAGAEEARRRAGGVEKYAEFKQVRAVQLETAPTVMGLNRCQQRCTELL